MSWKGKLRRGWPAGFLFLIRIFVICLFLTCLILACLLCDSCRQSRGERVVIGSKNFTESLILGEILAQQIESHTSLDVERRFYLQGTLICQQAILAGRIDMYPEYTGTAITAILKQKPTGDEQADYEQLKSEYERRFQLTLGPPFGFNDTFAIQIRGEDARRLQLHTISDVVPYAPHWRAGFGYEFMERSDGYHGLVATYGLKFDGPPRVMDLGLLARALHSGGIDLAAGNTTDGLIPVLDLFVLEDNLHYFPRYDAVPIIRKQILEEHPEIVAAIGPLRDRINDDAMRRLNYAVDGQHQDVGKVVREFLNSGEPR
jgi:glycine betaine/choline ABC-type transport system substrate-binding protein